MTNQPKILIVDDTVANLKLMVALLSEAGYSVMPVRESTRALETAQRGQPDLILLDVYMPDINGYELCRRIQADAALQNLPVILISAQSDPLDADRIEQLGAVDFIQKPFTNDVVLEKIAAHLGH